MRVDQAFLDNLGFKGGWRVETINNKTYYTIVNPTYCQIFWFRYWYEIGYKSFANQTFITQLKDGIITHKVIIDPQNGNIIQTPLAWTLVSYLGSNEFLPHGILQTDIPGSYILILYLIIMGILTILAYVFTK